MYRNAYNYLVFVLCPLSVFIAVAQFIKEVGTVGESRSLHLGLRGMY